MLKKIKNMANTTIPYRSMVNKISRCRSSSARSLSYSGSGPPPGISLLSRVSTLTSLRTPEASCAAVEGCKGCIIGCNDT